MKHHLVEVVISEHNLIVLKLIKHATRDLSTGVHYIRNYLFVHSFNGLGRPLITSCKNDMVLVRCDVTHSAEHLKQSLKRCHSYLIICEQTIIVLFFK